MKSLSLGFAVFAVVSICAGLALAQPARPPSGSYRQTCTNITFDGRVLTATCLNQNGRRVRTSMGRANLCRRDIANINGTLMCR
jgi:hypothetical protein